MTAPRPTLARALRRVGACERAVLWAARTVPGAWEAALSEPVPPKWVAWIAARLSGLGHLDPSHLRLALAQAAELGLGWVDPASTVEARSAVEVVRAFVRGEATLAAVTSAWHTVEGAAIAYGSQGRYAERYAALAAGMACRACTAWLFCAYTTVELVADLGERLGMRPEAEGQLSALLLRDLGPAVLGALERAWGSEP